MLVVISLLGLAISLYGYFKLLSSVPVFIEILAVFNTPLSPSTQLIFNTYNYYWLLSSIGLLALILIVFNKSNKLVLYTLLVSNILIMFILRWFVAEELHLGISQVGLIQ